MFSDLVLLQQANTMSKHTFIQISSALLILLFLYTGLSKLLNHLQFSEEIFLRFHSRFFAETMAYFIPVIEIIIAGFLFFQVTQLFGFYGSAILMFLFTVYVAYMLLFMPHLPCSCGGVIAALSWQQHLALNIFFLLLSLFGIKLKRLK